MIKKYLEDIELIPTSEDQKEMLNKPISPREAKDAINSAKSGEMPGRDGFLALTTKHLENNFVSL